MSSSNSLTIEELAFFWVPRTWKEIGPRLAAGRPGSTDSRDAVIEVDEDGGAGFLRWSKEAQTWVLTEKGRAWVSNFLTPAQVKRTMGWKLPKATKSRWAATWTIAKKDELPPDDDLPEAPADPSGSVAPIKAEESREEELSRLIGEQESDDS